MATALPAARRTHIEDRYGKSSRFYEIGGESYPSVTTILSCIGKPALVGWAARVERDLAVSAACDVYEELPLDAPRMSRMVYELSLRERMGKAKAHTRELAKAAEIGTEAHALIEWSMKREMGRKCLSKAPPASPGALVSFSRYQEWRVDADLRPKWIEQTVFSEAHKYAGTADWMGSLLGPDGVTCTALGDFKTGKAVYAEALLQNAAYVHAAQEMGYEVPCGVIVRLPKVEADPEFEVRWVPASDQQRLFEVFLAVKKLWDWQEQQAARDAAGAVERAAKDV